MLNCEACKNDEARPTLHGEILCRLCEFGLYSEVEFEKEKIKEVCLVVCG